MSHSLEPVQRAQYMRHEVSHHDYYAQFCTPRVLASVARGIGEEAIRASKGPPFNDIPLAKWGRLVGWDCPHVRNPLVGHARLALSREDSSLNTHVCIAKTAAAIIKKAQTP